MQLRLPPAPILSLDSLEPFGLNQYARYNLLSFINIFSLKSQIVLPKFVGAEF